MVSLSDIRDALPINVVPITLIILVVLTNMLFGITTVLPRWQTYEQLTSQIDAGKAALDERLTAQESNDMRPVLEAQITTAQEKLVKAAATFLVPSVADSIIAYLYRSANASKIEITNWQAQQPLSVPENSGYEARSFRMQAAGEMRPLLDAVAQMEQLSIPGIALSEVRISDNSETAVLTMNILIYTSPYASGNILLPPETLVPASQPVEPPVEILPTTLPAQDQEAPIVQIDCPDARPTVFRVGDNVIVQFASVGALRILEQPSGFDTLTQAYDGDELHLLDGPVCGTWHRENILYWYVDFNGVRGWAGEGDSKDRWMCPLSDIECIG